MRRTLHAATPFRFRLRQPDRRRRGDYSFIFSNGEYETAPGATSPLADSSPARRASGLPM